MDEKRTDYDVKQFQNQWDHRFETTTKEAVFAMGLYGIMVVLALALSYGLCPKDMSEMTYILGIPTWFFATMLMEIIVFVIAMVFNQKFSKEFSLDAREEKAKEEN